MPNISPNQSKHKILVIASESSFTRQLVSRLKDKNHSVRFEKTATDGLQALYDDIPHFVILDVTLHDSSGYDILQKKSAEPLLSKIPLFLLSTQSVPLYLHKVPQNSVSKFILALHHTVDQVVSMVNEHLKVSQKRVS